MLATQPSFDLSTTTRFSNGDILLPAISASDITSIKNAPNREEIGNWLDRLWEKICDWFCETEYARAKECLHDIYSPDTDDFIKLLSYLDLLHLTGNGYQSHFHTTSIMDGENDAIVFSLLMPDEKYDYSFKINQNNLIAFYNDTFSEIVANLPRHEVTMFTSSIDRIRNLFSQLKKIGPFFDLIYGPAIQKMSDNFESLLIKDPINKADRLQKLLATHQIIS